MNTDNAIIASQIRQFSGVVGLLYNNKGYYNYNGEENTWTYENVKDLIEKWIKLSSNKKITLCVGLSNVETLCYTYEEKYIEEPIVRVYGEIVSRHDGICDEEILNILFDLFTYLKIHLKQNSVRFNYQGFKDHRSYRIS
jgi:hypothetical protein